LEENYLGWSKNVATTKPLNIWGKSFTIFALFFFLMQISKFRGSSLPEEESVKLAKEIVAKVLPLAEKECKFST